MKKIIAVAAALVVAAGAYFANGLPLSDALAIATDSAKANQACADLLDGK